MAMAIASAAVMRASETPAIRFNPGPLPPTIA